LIPPVKHVEELGVSFRIPSNVTFIMDGVSPDIDHYWELYLTKWLAHEMELAEYTPPPGGHEINLFVEPDDSAPLGTYSIEITRQYTTISGNGMTGLMSAIETLKQLFQEALAYNGGRLRNQLVKDFPAYMWRGLHLDVSRHFFPVADIRMLIHWMTTLKLNILHWHLSDDQGWRIESKRFPLLTEKGAWRTEADGSRYGGFYTQEEIKSTLSYAAMHGITIVPEIDLPGHAMAMLSAYPELACFPKEFEPLSVWGISEDILCPGKDATLDFLKELLTEVAELFPGPLFHIGGDEAPKARWKTCPHCQKRIRDKKLKDEEALQGWLIRELQRHLNKLGKTVMGWDEILDGNPGNKPIISVWRGDGIDAAKKASQNGNRYVICPNQYLYFDWKATEDGPGAFGVTSLEKVMSLDPKAYEFDNPELLLGGQANLWTEHMPDFDRVEDMLFPRVYALAELFWAGRIEADFEERIRKMEEYL